MATTELLVPVDLWVMLVRRESREPLELLASRDCLAPLDQLVRLASPETEVSPETRVFLDLLVARESVVTPVLLDLPDLRDPWELAAPLEPPDPMVARESPVLLELPALLDTRVQVECPESAELLVLLVERERRERQATEDPRATMVEMELAVCLDPVVPPDPLVPMVTRERSVPSDLPALLVFADLLESVERLDLLELLDSPEALVLTVRLDAEESVDPLVERETSAPPALPDPLDSLDPLAPLDLPAPLVPVVTLVPLV